MKSKNQVKLITIKKNHDFLKLISHSKFFRNKSFQIWIKKFIDIKHIEYGISISKKNFKRAVTRNKIKRQVKSILTKIDIPAGTKIIIKPLPNYLDNTYINNYELLKKMVQQH